MNKVDEWLFFAETDLKSAKILLAEDVYFEVGFHAQQVVEKCLKAVLVSTGQRVPKIHSLPALLEKVSSTNNNFSSFEEAVKFLDPFYVSTRYPDVSEESLEERMPTQEEAKQAVKYAEDIFRFTTKALEDDKTQKGFGQILVLIVIALVGIGGYFFYKQQVFQPPAQVACTMEAKICPDGSSVGRTDPNCEFTECPADETAN